MKPTKSKNIHQEIFLALPDYRENLNLEYLFGNNPLTVTETPIIGYSPALLNGGFELHALNDFTNWLETIDGASEITAEAVEFHSGAHSCKMFINNGAFSTHISQSVLTIGQYYRLTFWAKYIADGGSLVAMNNATVILDTGALTENWTEYTVIFKATHALLKIANKIGASNNLVSYIDDVSLTKLTWDNQDDTSQKANVGTVTYPCTYPIDSILGKAAVHFHAADSKITYPKNVNTDIIQTAKTFIFWVNPINVATLEDSLFWQSGKFSIGLVTIAGKKMPHVYTFDDAETAEVELTAATDILTLNEWQMITVYIDVPNKVLGMYRNLTLLDSDVLPAGAITYPANATPTIGEDFAETESCNANVKMLRIYNQILTAEQLRQIYFHTRRHVLGLPPQP